MQNSKDHDNFPIDFVINTVGYVNKTASTLSNCFDVSTCKRIRAQHFESFEQIKRVAIGFNQSEGVDRIAIDALEIPFGIGRQPISGH